MNDVFGFHLYFPFRPLTEVSAAIDGAASKFDLQLVDATGGRWPARTYELSGCSPLTLSFCLEEPWSQAELAYLGRQKFECLGAQRMQGFLTGVCDELGARLGRSHGGGGYGLVQRDELDGELQEIGWLQYLSSPIVKRWGLETLLKGPFAGAFPARDGACVIQLGESPFELPLPKSAAAAYLGVPVRRLGAD